MTERPTIRHVTDASDWGWQRGAVWLALGVGTASLLLQLLLDSLVEEAVAIGLLTAVLVYALAFIANRLNGAKGP